MPRQHRDHLCRVVPAVDAHEQGVEPLVQSSFPVVLGTVTEPDTDEVNEIRAPRAGMLIGMAVPAIVLSGYGVFHLGYGTDR